MYQAVGATAAANAGHMKSDSTFARRLARRTRIRCAATSTWTPRGSSDVLSVSVHNQAWFTARRVHGRRSTGRMRYRSARRSTTTHATRSCGTAAADPTSAATWAAIRISWPPSGASRCPRLRAAPCRELAEGRRRHARSRTAREYGFWQKWSGDSHAGASTALNADHRPDTMSKCSRTTRNALAAAPQPEPEHEGRDSRARPGGAERRTARKRHGVRGNDGRADRASSATATISCMRRIPRRPPARTCSA